ASSQGSTLIRPSRTRRMIVPSERTEVGGVSLTPAILAALAVERAGARRRRAHTGRRWECRVAVGPAARAARERAARVRPAPLVAAVVALVGIGVGLLLHRPPHEPDRRNDRHLEREHQIDERPVHSAMLPRSPCRKARCYSHRRAGSSGAPVIVARWTAWAARTHASWGSSPRRSPAIRARSCSPSGRRTSRTSWRRCAR